MNTLIYSLKVLALLGLLCLSSLLYSQSKIEVYTVSKANPTSQKKSDIYFDHLSSSDLSDNVIQIFSGQKRQQLIGIGGAMTETSAAIIKTLPKEKQEEIYNAYFGAQGSDYSLLRSHIGSADFSTRYYSFDETPNDYDLNHFSVEEDQKYIIPAIKKAFDYNPNLKFFGAPWSPPSWMKKSGQRYAGHGAGSISFRDNSLKEDCYDAYARYLARYVQEYKNNGIPVWSVSVQNEAQNNPPWEGCTYSIDQTINFVGNHLGPVFEKEGIDSRILIWDWDKQNDIGHGDGIEKYCFNVLNSDASKYIYGVGFHWYGFDLSMDIAGMPQWSLKEFPSLDYLKDRFPQKHFIATEGCQEKGAWLNSWVPAARYIYDIINDFGHNTEGWIDWNLVLTEKGGYNHDGINNPCHSPIMVDTVKKEIIYNPSYYVLKQFSRNIRPEATVVKSDLNIWTDNAYSYINQVAVQNPDGSIALFISNSLNQPLKIDILDGDKVCKYTLEPNSLTTFVYTETSNQRDDLAVGKFVTASDTENGYNPMHITDDNIDSRWASEWNDMQWAEIDLGVKQSVNSISSIWENGATNDYVVEYLDDQNNWAEVNYLNRYTGSIMKNIGGPLPFYKRDFDLTRKDVSASYVPLHIDFFKDVKTSRIRIRGVKRNEKYGYSIYQVKVSGQKDDNILYRSDLTASASSSEKTYFPGLAIDNNGNTRWASDWVDNSSFTLDAGEAFHFSGLNIKWENGKNSEFKIQVSNDNRSFVDVPADIKRYSEYTHVSLDPQSAYGRFIRIQGVKKNTSYGYSIYDISVDAVKEIKPIASFKNTQKSSDPLDVKVNFEAYPNPIKGNSLYVKSPIDGKVAIYDLTGRQVKNAEVQKGVNELSIIGVNSGIYFIQLEDAKFFPTVKVVIQ
ncbi:MAG: discoidin domain-containing protein [Hyphomicrobiales bacterium]